MGMAYSPCFATIRWATLGYLENVGTQFLSLHQAFHCEPAFLRL
jgi:hypothetical protein